METSGNLFAPDNSRKLREYEIVIDCKKAAELFERANIGRTEEGAAEKMKLSRSTLRRILGKDGPPPWRIIRAENAHRFVEKCGGEIEDIEWTRTPTCSQNAAATQSLRAAHPQKIRWGPPDGLPAGIKISDEHSTEEIFIPWLTLLEELQVNLMPQLFADPTGYRFVAMDYHGKKDWVIKVVDAKDRGFCWLWLGVNPDDQ